MCVQVAGERLLRERDLAAAAVDADIQPTIDRLPVIEQVQPGGVGVLVGETRDPVLVEALVGIAAHTPRHPDRNVRLEDDAAVVASVVEPADFRVAVVGRHCAERVEERVSAVIDGVPILRRRSGHRAKEILVFHSVERSARFGLRRAGRIYLRSRPPKAQIAEDVVLLPERTIEPRTAEGEHKSGARRRDSVRLARMPGARVRWNATAEDEFEVIGHGSVWFDDPGIVASAVVIEPASLTELRRALDRYRKRMYDGDFEVHVFDASEDDVRNELEMLQARDVSLLCAPAQTFLQLVLVQAPEEPLLDQFETGATLLSLLHTHRARVADFQISRQKFATVYYLTVEISPRGRTVGDAMRIGDDLLVLWEASIGRGLNPVTVGNLLRAERPELLIGQTETEWLEAKQAPYGLGDPLQEIELAKDVSALANRPGGGLLVIGLVTKNRNGVDTVTAVRSQPMERLRPRRYRQALDKWIFPPLQDPRIETVEVEPGRGVMWIHIEPQPEALWPFLIVGAVQRGKVLGNHFSLVRRRGDETVVDPAAVVHGLLVAGRVALATAPRNATARGAHDRNGPVGSGAEDDSAGTLGTNVAGPSDRGTDPPSPRPQ